MKLYELTGQFAAFQEAIESGAELDEQTINDTLESIEGAITEKLESIGKLIRNLEAEATGYEAEEKRLCERKKSIRARIESIRKYCTDTLIASGIDKVKGIVSLYLQTSPPSVEVVDEGAIPPEYFIPQPPKLNKQQILEIWKEKGATVAGVNIITDKKSLRLR